MRDGGYLEREKRVFMEMEVIKEKGERMVFIYEGQIGSFIFGVRRGKML